MAVLQLHAPIEVTDTSSPPGYAAHLSSERDPDPARGRRYPAGVRNAVTGYALERRDAGASWSTIEDELGMRYETVRRWCHATARETGIVPVEVVLEDVPPRSEVAIVSPAGYRLEGLEPV